MTNTTRRSPEVRERAVRLFNEHHHEYRSKWAALGSIAEKIGCSRETLRHWCRQSQVDTGERDGISSAERERLAALENREPRAQEGERDLAQAGCEQQYLQTRTEPATAA